MTTKKPPAITCYLAVPLGADEAHLKEIFANMDKYYAPARPVGRSWLLRGPAPNTQTLGEIVGKAYTIQVDLRRNHREEILRTGAIIQQEEPKGKPELLVTPSRRVRDRSHEKERGWRTKAEFAAAQAASAALPGASPSPDTITTTFAAAGETRVGLQDDTATVNTVPVETAVPEQLPQSAPAA